MFGLLKDAILVFGGAILGAGGWGLLKARAAKAEAKAKAELAKLLADAKAEAAKLAANSLVAKIEAAAKIFGL